VVLKDAGQDVYAAARVDFKEFFSGSATPAFAPGTSWLASNRLSAAASL